LSKWFLSMEKFMNQDDKNNEEIDLKRRFFI